MLSCSAVAACATADEPRSALVYIGHADPVSIVLTAVVSQDTCGNQSSADCVPVQLDDVTRVTLLIGGVTLDSDVDVGVFDWTGQDTAGNDLLVIRPGLVLTAPVTGFVRLVLYSAAVPAGVVWISEKEAYEPTLELVVCAA